MYKKFNFISILLISVFVLSGCGKVKLTIEESYNEGIISEVKLLREYTKKEYDKAVKKEKVVILYFYADWSQNCKAEFEELKKASAKLNGKKIAIFRVNKDDFATEEENNLIKEYGVVYQPTKIIIKSGKQVLKTTDKFNEQNFASMINKYL